MIFLQLLGSNHESISSNSLINNFQYFRREISHETTQDL